MQPEGGKDINSGIHAGDDGHALAGSWIGDVGPGVGVALVGGKELIDLCHVVGRG
jgi:hypothetical protein